MEMEAHSRSSFDDEEFDIDSIESNVVHRGSPKKGNIFNFESPKNFSFDFQAMNQKFKAMNKNMQNQAKNTLKTFENFVNQIRG